MNIYAHITHLVCIADNHNYLYDIWYNAGLRENIIEQLEQLKPDKPEDGTVGFIAFSAGDNKPRIKTKTGRFLTRKLKLNSNFFNDAQIRELAESINSELFPNITTKLLNGLAITGAYRKAIGSSSCMTDSNSKLTRMYADNPDRFQLLVMFWQNDSARAIVHKLDNGKYLLGRIYSSSKILLKPMLDYAKKNNWYAHDAIPIIDLHTWIMSDLEYEDGYIPYQDTLTQYKIQSNDKIQIFHSAFSSGDGTLDMTNGYLEPRDCCYNCNDIIYEDSCFYPDNGNIYCEDCYNEIFTYCDHCEETTLRENIVHIVDIDKYYCGRCVDNHCIACNDCGHIVNEKWHELNNGGAVCYNCAEEYYRCEICEEYFVEELIDNCCEDCAIEEIHANN